MQDPYSILGVSRDASEDEIKRAYRKMAKKYPPDVNKDPGAEDKFIEIQNAYQQIMEYKKHGGGPQDFWSQSNYYQQGYSNSSYSGSAMNDFQTAVNYLNMGQYQAAYNVLVNIADQDRDASWYYLFAIANYGLGNQIAAVDAAEKACNMDPSNQQYRQLYAQLQQGRSYYRSVQTPLGNLSSLCCNIILCSMCCGNRGLCLYPICCC